LLIVSSPLSADHNGQYENTFHAKLETATLN